VENCWVQVGVAPVDGRVYARLARLADDLLAEPGVTNFFFMVKPPGLRVRFETCPDRQGWLAGVLERRLAGTTRIGVYEPEAHLFGGPASMAYVHRLFTVDARAWLAFHELSAPGPGWQFSLALLRHLLGGLAVAGWEDLDVWERIRTRAGRDLPPGLDPDRAAVAAEGIRAHWTGPRDALPAPARALADRWGPPLSAAARDWLTGYFRGAGAAIGPREGAAFATVFHWNRGRLPAVTQALLATALADRAARP